MFLLDHSWQLNGLSYDNKFLKLDFVCYLFTKIRRICSLIKIDADPRSLRL